MPVPNTPGNAATANTTARESGLLFDGIAYDATARDYFITQGGRKVARIDIMTRRVVPLETDAPADASIDLAGEPITAVTQPAFVPREDLQGDPRVSAPQEVGGFTVDRERIQITVDEDNVVRFGDPDTRAQRGTFTAFDSELISNPAFLVIGAALIGWWIFN